MFRFPCGFSTTHSESLNLQTATQLCYNIHPDTSMHVIVLITNYAITQQAHSCSTGLRRNGSTATRPPNVEVGGCQATGRVWPKAIHHRCLEPATDWKRAQSKCHADNVDSMSTCYSISRMCLHLIHHQLSRRWEHHRS